MSIGGVNRKFSGPSRAAMCAKNSYGLAAVGSFLLLFGQAKRKEKNISKKIPSIS